MRRLKQAISSLPQRAWYNFTDFKMLNWSLSSGLEYNSFEYIVAWDSLVYMLDTLVPTNWVKSIKCTSITHLKQLANLIISEETMCNCAQLLSDSWSSVILPIIHSPLGWMVVLQTRLPFLLSVSQNILLEKPSRLFDAALRSEGVDRNLYTGVERWNWDVACSDFWPSYTWSTLHLHHTLTFAEACLHNDLIAISDESFSKGPVQAMHVTYVFVPLVGMGVRVLVLFSVVVWICLHP